MILYISEIIKQSHNKEFVTLNLLPNFELNLLQHFKNVIFILFVVLYRDIIDFASIKIQR